MNIIFALNKDFSKAGIIISTVSVRSNKIYNLNSVFFQHKENAHAIPSKKE